MSIKANLKRLRKAAGLTQALLARQAGVPQSMISDLERGNRVSTSFLPELARILKCEVRDLDPRYAGNEPLAPEVSAKRSSDVELYSGQLADSDSILISVVDLQIVVLQALHHGEISEKAALAAVHELVATLAIQPSVHVVRKLKPPNRKPLVLPRPARDDLS